MSTIPAGWYPDPEREGATRWWDGQQWGPSQEAPAAGGADDRFRRQDEPGTSDGAGAGWAASTPAAEGSAWRTDAPAEAGAHDREQAHGAWQGEQHGHDQGAWRSGQDQGAWQGGHDQGAWQHGQGAGQADGAAAGGAWQAAPAWSTPQGGDAQGAWQQPQQAAPQDWSTQGWSSQQQPPRRRTGLIVGIVVGIVVLLGLLVAGGVLAVGLVGGIVSASQSGPGSTGPTDPGAGGGTTEGVAEVGTTTRVTVPVDGTAELELVLEEDGRYAISVENVNMEDPVLTVVAEDGTQWMDDDGGDGFDPLLEQRLDAGTYTLIVHEYGGDELVADVTVTQE